MKRALLAFSVATILAVPLAVHADVELFGELRGSVDFTRDGDNTPGDKSSAVGLQSNNSYLGLRGDEDLGSDWSVVWQLEHDFDLNTNSSTENVYSDAESFLGLASAFGQIRAGMLNTPYKASTLDLDPFLQTRGDYRAIMGTTDGVSGAALFDNKPSDTIEYRSPNLAGFSAELAYTFGGGFSGNGDSLPLTKAQGRQNAYGGAVAYAGGPLYLTAAYEQLNDFGYVADNRAGQPSAIGGADARATKLGGSYTILDATTLAVIWESIGVGGITGNRDAYYFSAQHKLGGATLMVAYGKAGTSGFGQHDGASQYTIGAFYSLSKDTDIYTLFSVLNNDSNGVYTLEQVPNVVGTGGDVLTGKDVSAISIGINYRFSSK